MPTSSFRSTTRTTSTSSSFSSTNRRSRSVTRFEETPPVNWRGKVVKTLRGSGAPDISLDDLAVELFSSNDFGRVSSSVSERESSRPHRGRSVSRRGCSVAELRNCSGNRDNNDGNGNGNGVFDGASRRRRSLSVASRRISDSENGHFQKNQKHNSERDRSVLSKDKPSWQKPTASSQQKGLRRCSSQKDFLRSLDGYSSYSSTLTDDEGNDTCNVTNGVGKELHPAYAHPKVIAENFDSVQSAQGDVLKTISSMRRSYRTQLEQSEKRKQELLAEIMFVEEGDKELKRIVGELRPTSKETAATRRPTRGRKRSKDRKRMSKQLVDDADKIIEDFISSFEETDFSSFDGERSDTSSIIEGAMKLQMQYDDVESFKTPLRSDLLPDKSDDDGVVLPWLKWETSNDITLFRSDGNQCYASPDYGRQDEKEESAGAPDQEQSVNTKSSCGSWSPGVANSFTPDIGDISKTSDVHSCKSHLLSGVPRRSQIDIDDYLKPPSDESFLFERWKYRQRINSGGLLICHTGCLGKFFV